MSTTMEKPQNVSRKWYILDAAGKPLGRTAAQAAVILRGKHKPTFTPLLVSGYTFIIFTHKTPFTHGKSLWQKFYTSPSA